MLVDDLAHRAIINAPGHCIVRACLLHCLHVRLCNSYTQAYAQIMKHAHTHKAVTGHVDANKSLSRRRQSNYSTNCWLLKLLLPTQMMQFFTNSIFMDIWWTEVSIFFHKCHKYMLFSTLLLLLYTELI